MHGVSVSRMALTPTEQLTENVRLAIFSARVKLPVVSAELGISTRTLQRRLEDGRFTMSDIETIARLTNTTLFDLLPAKQVA